ncbi:hypothetical protein BU14_2637s0001 [Porphyra umbilicalis]|uniref:Uncharacterized protein n=1 Tax=Porphyra umbilicalis TaxID=2786 RepID=A0A1X6NIT6_PORUM|nr:hypothetical protein BU14_2637s0001 [Porphyra umbilicalis]|eukprot:OSX68524.1 hypothetical protein BU14_2637s0001 [Porphyra umbilicalis]
MDGAPARRRRCAAPRPDRRATVQTPQRAAAPAVRSVRAACAAGDGELPGTATLPASLSTAGRLPGGATRGGAHRVGGAPWRHRARRHRRHRQQRGAMTAAPRGRSPCRPTAASGQP